MRELFESTIERLFTDQVTPERVLQAQSDVWAADLWQVLDESGFALAAVAEDQGGAGADWGDLCGVVRACGRFALPLPLPEAMLANWLLGRAGLEALPGALSFAADASLTFEAGVVSGQVRGVPWGRSVQHIVAMTEGNNPRVVVLPVEAAGDTKLCLNTAAEPRDDIAFTGVTPVASAELSIAADTLRLGGAMLRSAQIAGALEAVLDQTTIFAGERAQFGRAIGKFQAIQQQLALLAEHTAASKVAAEAAFTESGRELALLQVMAAKICSAEAASVGAAIAHAVHGAIGFTHEHHLHLMTRRLWSWRSEYGSLSAWSQQLGSELCRGGAASFWPTLTQGHLNPQPKESQ